jgi:hypothetical protein
MYYSEIVAHMVAADVFFYIFSFSLPLECMMEEMPAAQLSAFVRYVLVC